MPTNLGEIEYSEITRIAGQAEDLAADVESQLGKNALTTKLLIIESEILNDNITVGASAIELKVGSSRQTNRRSLLIQPKTGPIYIGPSGVTTATGIMVMKNQIVIIDSSIAWYGIASANMTVSVIEAK